MVALLRSMEGDHPARPCLVFSNDPSAGALTKAQAMGVTTEALSHKPYAGDRTTFETDVQKIMDRHAPDIICLAGFMRVLTEHFVSQWQGRMINIHPSLLPKYRGLNTHARAIEAGDTFHGCTVHEVTPALDDGPILGQARVPILKEDTPTSLAARVLAEEHQLYPDVLRRFASGSRIPVWRGGRGPFHSDAD